MLHFYFVGKTKNYSTQIYDYVKRLQRFTSVETHEITLSKLENMMKNTFVVVLDERGTLMNSVQFSTFLEKQEASHVLAFVVGPAEGLPSEIKKQADVVLSLSPMTLQHDLARLILLEQVYRACTILKKLPYHKD